MPRSQSWLHTVFLSLVVVIHLPTGLAQDDPASSTESPTTSSIAPDQPSPTNSAPAQTYTIQVGLADHKFKPEVTTANIGDTIEFAFYPRNHSVVRAEYGFPCIPYEMTGASKTGFFAGFHTVDTVLSSPPTYRILINDTDPIFFYCSAPGSCLTYGMVGAINPNASMSVQKQQQLALSSTYMLNPGEPFPDESPSASNPATSSATANTDTGKPADEKGLSTGAIVGIVVGGSSIIFVAALFFFFWGRTTSLANEVSRKPGSRRWGIHGSGKSSAAMLEQSHRANMTATENPLHQQYYYHNPHHHHHPHHNHHSPHEAPPAGTHATDTRNGSYHQHYPPAPHHATYSSVLGYNHTSSPVTRPLYLAAPYPPPPLSTTATTPKHTTIPHQAFFQHHQQLPSSSSPHELSPTGDSPTHKGFAESSSGGLDAASASGLASTTMAIPATNTNATANTAAAPNTNTATALPPAPPTPHNTQDMTTTTTTTTTTSEQAKPENHKTTPPQHNNNTTTAKTNTTTTAIPTTNTASTTNAKTTSIVAASVDEPDTSELVPSYFDSVYQGRGRAS